ncbi:TonB-linked outer membrane protein, SusC/RagA family [Chitinophaga sp. YR573]|uniref:TonB-dependent receptor n=1 Tax=Chitinophaga sp. YR573 TaxID=1881040 RepID=UPI0008B6A63C|nr:TonB-dependent receptor [Chitinophaga sp. YR573]SEW25292.1 TonB-linked outer membrane protein, SusC/RagA family [Chitinophaga sp. YR573]
MKFYPQISIPWTRILRITFIQIFITIAITGFSYSESLRAQDILEKKINVSFSNVSLAEGLKTIEKTNGVKFIFSKDAVNTELNVSITSTNEELRSVLNKLLTQNNISYEVIHDAIVLQKKVAAGLVVSGKVTDGKGGILIGVSVFEKGTNKGTTTTSNGTYKLTIDNPDAILVFKYIGYATKEIPVDGKSVVNAILTEEATSLNEVNIVNIGYGSKKKIDLTGAVNSLSSEDIANSKAPNAQEALQGRMPGVDVKRSSGRPGADFTIEIRGVNSISGGTQPLYVVDGIQVSNINDINPADIERMDVLKDASSTAIFGSRGANGVVIVTTKRGIKGALRINYDAYVGVVNAYNLPDMMNGPEFVAYDREFINTQAQQAALVGGTTYTPVTDDKIFSATELANIASGTYTDWYKLIRRDNALQTNHNLSITGGDDKTTYFLSAGYQLYNGAVQVENTKKYNLKTGFDRTFNNVFKVGASIYTTFADINPGSAEVFRSAGRLRPTGSPYNADGSLRFFPSENESQITNPLFEFDNEIRRAQYIRLLPNIFAELSFLKDFKFRTSFTPDLTFQRTGTYNDTYSKANAGTKPASATNGSNHWTNYTWNNVLSYNKQIGVHRFDALLGSSSEYHQYDYNQISVVGLPYRSLWYNVGNLAAYTNPATGVVTQPSTTASSGYTRQNIQSYFFRANYTYKNRYLFTVTGRGDGNSIFAAGHQWGFFPSGAFAWIVSEENFMKKISAISLLKLRLSAGKSGNAAVATVPAGNISGASSTTPYLGPYITQSSITGTYYDFNGANANGFAPSVLADKNLSWEKTTEYNAGIDLELFKGRIAVTLDYYNKTAKGTILQETIPYENGFSTVVTNLGSIRNSGIEVGLNTINIHSEKFTWSTNINFAINKNKILELYGTGKDDIANSRFIGQKSRVVYAYKITGVWQTNEADAAKTFGQYPGQYKIDDHNNDGKINASDRQVIGSDIPNWFGGITNTFKYANFDLSATVYTRQGTLQQSTFLNQFLDGDQNRARFNAYNRSYWTYTNPSNKWANNAIETDGTRRLAAEYSNSSYIKISNITLGYTLPKRVIGKTAFKNIRVYADAYNPFIWTKFIGWDPETADLTSGGAQDFRTRTFMFGLQVTL